MLPVLANTGEYVNGASMVADDPPACTTLGRKYSYQDADPDGNVTSMDVAFSTSIGYTMNCNTAHDTVGRMDNNSKRHTS